jgi:hypothetical protein
MRRLLRHKVAIGALFAGLHFGMPIACAEEAGWSTSYDPRHRVFLSFRSVEGGPRHLLLGCLRDVDTFTVAAESIVGAPSDGKATLSLTNGAARYAVDGELAPDPDTRQPGFSVDGDLDAQARRELRRTLLPVLEGKGPIELAIGSARRELPALGLASALRRFKSVCFGGR